MNPVLAQAAQTVAMPTAWFWPAVFGLVVALIAFLLKDLLDRVRADIRANGEALRDGLASLRREADARNMSVDGEIRLLRERSHEQSKLTQNIIARMELAARVAPKE